MSVYISQQCFLFFYSILFGFLFGLVYDVFRIFRIAIKHNQLLIFCEDMAFCLSFSLSYILFNFCVNSGVLRWFSLFGAALGFVLYLLTVGRLIMLCSHAIIRFIRMVFHFILSRLLCPVCRWLYRFLRAVCLRMNDWIQSAIENKYRKQFIRLFLCGCEK